MQALALMDMMGRDLQEHAADITAQYYLMLRRRSPMAMLQLFEKWDREGKGKDRWSRKGLAGYFSRTHPDAAERVRALVAFNGAMEGNKEVYPVELRNKPQTTSFVKELRADTDKPEYRRDVLADLQDRIARFHRKRVQSIPKVANDGVWNVHKVKLRIEDYDIPHLPLNQALQAESEIILKEGLERSEQQLISFLANKLETELAKPLTVEQRSRLHNDARDLLELLLKPQQEFETGTDAEISAIAKKNEQNSRTHEAKIRAIPGYKALESIVRRDEQRLLIEADQLFHDEHPTYFRNRSRESYPIGDALRKLLDHLPDSIAGNWLKKIPERIRKGDPSTELKETRIALRLLHPGDKESYIIQGKITGDDYLDLMDKLLQTNPGFAVTNLEQITELMSKNGRRDGWQLVEPRRARLVSILSRSLTDAPVDAYLKISLDGFVERTGRLGISPQVYAPQLREALNRKWGPGQIVLGRVNYSNIRDLFAMHKAFPELRPILEPILEKNLRFYHLSLTDPDADEREAKAAASEAIAILRAEGKTDAEISDGVKNWKIRINTELPGAVGKSAQVFF
jgi:hypothetical protein